MGGDHHGNRIGPYRQIDRRGSGRAVDRDGGIGLIHGWRDGDRARGINNPGIIGRHAAGKAWAQAALAQGQG